MKKNVFLIFLSLMSVWSMAQELTITGRVTDSAQDPIVGASVVVKGTTQGTITDIDGNYSLKVNNLDVTLVYSFIGMKSQEILLANQRILNVTLQDELTDIDEILVIGYGQTKKASNVAAISSVSADEIVKTPTANLMTGLSGKMPGMTIMVKDGELGSEKVDTYIRGQATVNGTAPLILVDGVEREMTSIDPYDVENVSILKDASATAVFGVRGANGVILITTKKGVTGKAQVTANVNYSLQGLTRLPKPVNAYDLVTIRNSVIEQHNEWTGSDDPLQFSQDVVDFYAGKEGNYPDWYPEYYVDRDWYGEMMHKYVPMTKANVNISGGSEKSTYFVSAGYMSQGGPFKTEGYSRYGYDNEQRLDRFTYRANIDLQINETLKGWIKLSGFLQDKNDPVIYPGFLQGGDLTTSTYVLQLAAFTDIPALSFPDYNEDGDIVSIAGKDRTPYGQINRTGYRSTTKNTLNNTIGLEQKLDFITEGLSAKAIVSYDATAIHARAYHRTYATVDAGLVEEDGVTKLIYSPGTGTDTHIGTLKQQSFATTYDLEASLNYNRSFNQHNVTGLFLYKENERNNNLEVARNYVNLVGRATYAYNSKYLAEFNFGMNGSEQFAKGRRFGFFPSVSLGWVLSEESFLQSAGFIKFLKLRGSFGQVGNDNLPGLKFLYVDDWAQGGVDGAGLYDGTYFKDANLSKIGLGTPVFEKSMPNPLVSWEVADKYNIGLESRFLDGFEFDLDMFYEKRNSVLITTTPIPQFMFGQRSLPPTNDGVMENKGLEATLAYNKKINRDLLLGARYSFAYARNKRISFNETPLDDTYAYRYREEGYSIGTLWGYDCLGYFTSQDEIDAWANQDPLGDGKSLPGDLKYNDVNGDGIIDSKDMVPMKYPNVPEINMALTLTANYKNWDFSALIQGVSNYTFNFQGRGINDWESNYNDIGNYFEHHKYAWTEERYANGKDIRYPRLHIDGKSVSKQPSDYWLIELMYARLKNVELGYTIPKNIVNKIGLEKVRMYFNGANLITVDNMPEKILDPEVNNSLSHPIFKTYNFGLNVTF